MARVGRFGGGDQLVTGLPTLETTRDGFVKLDRLPMSGVRRDPAQTLDGVWDFQLLEHPKAPLGEWATAEVPSLWTMQSPQDRPHYTNVPMPFDEVPPQVPGRNPTGVYRRTVTLAPVAGRRLVLRVGAAEGALHAFVNGTPVGASTDSHLAAEFDITDAVLAGENEVMLVVAKFSAESFLEDQDQWWHGGISRSVEVLDLPAVRIADVRVVADFDARHGTGSLDIEVVTEGLAHLREHGYRAQITVATRSESSDVTGRQDAQTLPKPSDERDQMPQSYGMPSDMMDLISMSAAGAEIPEWAQGIAKTLGQTAFHDANAGEAKFHLEELEVLPWTAEMPHLETLAVRLLDAAGDVVDEAEFRIGFRRVEIVGRDLLVNGTRIMLQGVNRHDFDPRTGRVLSREAMLREILMMKQHHINAIRTSHYPNDPYLLDLCDEHGLYVVDEADIEGHAFAGSIADDPRYLTAFHERFSRMVLRDRNHPSVIIWSLGNETGHGAAHPAMASWSRSVDPTRPVQYEGAIAADWHAGHVSSDIVCPMYPSFGSLESFSADPRADRPVILCEYAYSQGNATGGLAHYWQLFESLPGLQGGFIWEWRDHGLDPDGDGRYRYGGDFGDEPNNGNTLSNGVVFPDLTPQPALDEIRGIFLPVRIVSDTRDLEQGVLSVLNRQQFASLAHLRAELRVEHAEQLPQSFDLTLPDVAAGETATIALEDAVLEALAVKGALALSLVLRAGPDLLWAAAGTELGIAQLELDYDGGELPRGEAPSLAEDGGIAHPLLVAPPELCLWRALTEQDNSFALDKRFVRSGFFRLERSRRTVGVVDGATTIRTEYRAAFGATVAHTRRIEQVGDGDYVLHERVDLPEGTSDGLRVGMEMTLSSGLDTVRWTGLGPGENYPDRRAGATLGTWQRSIDDMDVPYLKPQENGTRGGVWSTCLEGPAGAVTTTHAQPLHLSASRHTIADLESSAHWWELDSRETTTVHLDIAHRGVGSALIGPDTRPQFRLAGDHYEWSWRLTLDAAAVAQS